MSSASPFTPSSPETVAIRPLNGGMILDQPSNALKQSQFLRLKNLIAGREGLLRRPGFVKYAQGDSVDDDLVDFIVYWKPDGTQAQFLVGRKLLYTASITAGFDKVTWDYTDASLDGTSGTTVTGDGTTWEDDDIKAGDVMVLDADGSGDGPEEIEIDAVTDNNTVELVSTPAGTYGDPTDYTIYRGFASQEPFLVDHTVTPNEIVFTSAALPVATFNPTTSVVEEFVTGSDLPAGSVTRLRAATCTYLPDSERLFIGNTWEKTASGWTQYRQRIRWSKVGDYDDFSDSTAFIDLPFGAGQILTLLPLGSNLVVYFEDAVILGTPTNIEDVPFSFQMIETGGNGLLGMRAALPWLDGHYFVSQDDVYYLAVDGTVEKIGTPVITETIQNCASPWRIYSAMDPSRFRVAFGFPEDSTDGIIERIWSFEYREQVWSYDTFDTWFLSSPVLTDDLTWNDLSGTWTTGFTNFGATWESLSLGKDNSIRTLYAEYEDGLVRAVENTPSDPDSTQIPVEIITPDYDLGKPDQVKTFTRMGLRLEAAPTVNISFTVQGSTTEGEAYKNLGTLTVPVGKHEGKINFRLTGTAIRFRITSSQDVASYKIIEMTFRVRGRSPDFSLMSQA